MDSNLRALADQAQAVADALSDAADAEEEAAGETLSESWDDEEEDEEEEDAPLTAAQALAEQAQAVAYRQGVTLADLTKRSKQGDTAAAAKIDAIYTKAARECDYNARVLAEHTTHGRRA